MPYPKLKDGRVQWWLRKISFSTDCLEPYLEIGRRLKRLYENVPATDREKIAEQSAYGMDNTGRVKPSLVFGWIDQSIANMLFRNPVFRASALTETAVEHVDTVRRRINHWYDTSGQFEQDERVLLDAFLYPYGVKKKGWSKKQLDEEDIPLSEAAEIALDDPEEENLWLSAGTPTEVMDEHDHEEHIKKHMELIQDDESISQDIKDEIIQGHIDEHNVYMNKVPPDPNSTVREEAPFGLWWSPEDFRIDPYARDGNNDAQWQAFRSVRRVEDVQNDQRYIAAQRNQVKATSRVEGAPKYDHAAQTSLGEDDFGIVVLWEIWGKGIWVSPRKRRNVYTVIAEQGGEGSGNGLELLHKLEWPIKGLKNFPGGILAFLKAPHGWVQKPLLNLAGSDNAQSLINEQLDRILSVVRKQKNIIFYDSDVYNDNEIETGLKSIEDLAVGVPNLSQRGPASLIPMPWPEMGNQSDFIEIIMGIFDRAAGTPQPVDRGGDTATEAAITERRTTAREAKRLLAFERFQIETAEDFWAMDKEFNPELELAVEGAGKDQPGFETASPKDLTGRFKFDIDISSQSTAEAIERKQWLDLLNLAAGIPEVFGAEGVKLIAEKLLTRGYNIKNPQDYLSSLDAGGGQVDQAGLQGLLQQVQGGGNGGNGGAKPPGPVNPQQFNAPAPSASAIAGEAMTV